MWAERSRHSHFDQSRRRNLASIQRFLPKETTTTKPPTSPPPTPNTAKNEKITKNPEEKPQKQKSEPILPAGGSTSQREMVLMKLSKRISAVETNLTLSTEYLSELSKQYVTQMSGYQQELKETRKASKQSAQSLEVAMRAKMSIVKRELRELRQSVLLLQKLEHQRNKQAKNEMSRNIFMSSCHYSSNVPP
uniref:Uncharacterized protein n=1 Tax=Caenorhabditis japonica TaxID=281687 RepID=A0A8R1I8X9_CAEJA